MHANLREFFRRRGVILIKINGKSGFTLVEVMLAIMIVLIASAGTSMYIISSRKNLLAARVQRAALNLAETRLDEYKQGVAGEEESSEPVTADGFTFDVTTEIERTGNTRIGGGNTLHYDCYEATITVEHALLHNPVVLQTIYPTL